MTSGLEHTYEFSCSNHVTHPETTIFAKGTQYTYTTYIHVHEYTHTHT